MLRKIIVALLAVAAVGLVSPTGAFARGGGGHGGGGGFHGGGFHGGGFRGGGWGGVGIGALGWGLGYGYPYYYYGYPGYYEGGCYWVRQRVLTRYGWRIRRVEICD